MSRIASIFQSLRESDGRALMPYITAGDPDLETTAALLRAAEAGGASICEVGVPFSDPIADGPVIQASMTHALDAGVKVDDVFEMVQQLRPESQLGIVAMLSYSIVHRRGAGKFAQQAKDAGFDGLIIPDLPVEESNEMVERCRDTGVALSFLIAPTSSIGRVRQLAAASTGFVYLLARAGITGEQQEVAADLSDRIVAVREATDLPIAVGFGVSTSDHVRKIVRESGADAAIVGSAIMRRVAELRDGPRDDLVRKVGQFISDLATGLTV